MNSNLNINGLNKHECSLLNFLEKYYKNKFCGKIKKRKVNNMVNNKLKNIKNKMMDKKKRKRNVSKK